MRNFLRNCQTNFDFTFIKEAGRCEKCFKIVGRKIYPPIQAWQAPMCENWGGHSEKMGRTFRESGVDIQRLSLNVHPTSLNVHPNFHTCSNMSKYFLMYENVIISNCMNRMAAGGRREQRVMHDKKF